MSVTYLHIFYDEHCTARRVSDMTYASLSSIGDGKVWLVAPSDCDELYLQWLDKLKEQFQDAFDKTRITYALDGSNSKVGFAQKSITITKYDIEKGYMPEFDDYLMEYAYD